MTFQDNSKKKGGKVKSKDSARGTLATTAPKDPKEFFKGGSRVKQKKGLRVGLWGPPGSGKTHCALTFPKPIYVIDSEFGTYPLLEQPEFEKWLEPNVPEDMIKVFEAAVLDEHSAEPDPLLSLESCEAALTSLIAVESGTVILDSGADLWGFINTWLEDAAVKRSAKGDKYQFEWGKANARYRLLMMRVLSKPLNFVITGQANAIRDSSGKATTGIKPAWQMKTPHWVDLSIRCTRGADSKFRGMVTKCRLGDQKIEIINPPTYDNIIKWAKKEFPWREFLPQGITKIDDVIMQKKETEGEEAIVET